MVVWHSPCESSTPPGSQFNKTAPLERAGAFLLAEIWWCTARAGRSHATKTSGTFLDSFSWPRSGEPQGWGEQCSTPPTPTPATAPAGCGIVQAYPWPASLRDLPAAVQKRSWRFCRHANSECYCASPFAKEGVRAILFSCFSDKSYPTSGKQHGQP